MRCVGFEVTLRNLECGEIPTGGAKLLGYDMEIGIGSEPVACEFDSHYPCQINAGVAQLVEHRIENPSVVGSTPTACTKC